LQQLLIAVKTHSAVQAVESYLDLNEWQTNAIRDAVRTANRRNARFVDHDEVDSWLATWGTARER
jgi:predicted transcriptional regulator